MKPKGYWTESKVKEDAKKYNSKMEWKNNSSTAYSKASTWNILNECCKHMEQKLKPKGYWNKDRIKTEALKYKTKSDWMKSNMSSYSIACKKNILDECCKHMVNSNNGRFVIYSFEFSDKSYYVGLTRRTNGVRHLEHLSDRNSAVYKHIIKTNTDPIYKVLWGESVYDYIAQQKEKEWDEYYINNGWNRLNTSKTGGLGSLKHRKWTINKIKEDALKYKTKIEWIKNNYKSYDAAYRYGVIDICSSHMDNNKKSKGYWTIDRIKEEALKYKTKTEWKTKNTSSYSIACKKKIIGECCKHMLIKNKPKGYWTINRIKEETSKYETKNQWKINSSGSYNAANRLNILNNLIF